MAKTKGAKTISAHIPNEIVDRISKRADALHLSESRYIRMIIEKWISEGAPPVSPLDEMAQKLAKKSA